MSQQYNGLEQEHKFRVCRRDSSAYNCHSFSVSRQTPSLNPHRIHLKVLCEIVNLLNLVQLPLVIKLEILEQPISKSKHPAMDNRELILRPALLHCCGLDDVPALLVHIELHKTIVLLLVVCNRVELVLVQTVHVADVSQPWVQQAHVLGCHGSFDTTAAVMAAYDNVLDFEVTDSVVYDRHDVEVDVVDEIGDVAVDEHFAWFQAGDSFGGNARVGAACVMLSVYVFEVLAVAVEPRVRPVGRCD
jgi:hypothetical protein